MTPWLNSDLGKKNPLEPQMHSKLMTESIEFHNTEHVTRIQTVVMTTLQVT